MIETPNPVPLVPVPPHPFSLGFFSSRLLVLLIMVGLAAAIWRLTDVLMLLFAGILIAITLDAGGRGLTKYTRLPALASLTAVVLIGLAAFALTFWVFGAMATAQFNKVLKVAPEGLKVFMAQIGENTYGHQLIDQLQAINIFGATGWATSFATSTVSSIVTGLAYTLVTLFVAIYLAAEPGIYVKLCLRLTPPAHRHTAQHVFDVSTDTLRRWIIGRLVVMVAIGILSGIGLSLLGIEGAFVLGLMGGLLCFIPFVGAIMAAVPATLVALTQGPLYALAVIAMYVGVHVIEGNFITPLVQAKATSLPPVLSLLSTIAFGVLLGPSGALLAAPLTLVLLTITETVYVQGGLGEKPET